MVKMNSEFNKEARSRGQLTLRISPNVYHDGNPAPY